MTSLDKLMEIDELDEFRLVGGTSLSLQMGHRESVDIDLFTDQEYGTVDFNKIDEILRKSFVYVDSLHLGDVTIGKSYFVGENRENLIKLDLFCTDSFVFPIVQHNNLRMASMEEIAAMKLEIIGQGGRKKDFWDLHELIGRYSLTELLEFYVRRYRYGYTQDEIKQKLRDFSQAEDDLPPICHKDKSWELIKLDFEDLV
ncbi:nucleotidyl transferase AbiEii/AbiGii toxin family protein [Poritiphilus flavus]|nr:nucleotidyl transferase AbiEii/AbiGii toxin family protein [Poritiphilus flavus]